MLAATVAPDLFIIDLDLGESIGGLELVTELRRRGSQAKVLICSRTSAPHVVAGTFTAGANGYLFKTATSDEALLAVRTVLGGKAYYPVSIELLRAASARFDARVAREMTISRAGLNSLTPREREVFKHLRRGLSSREVAAVLGIREKTIERYRASIRSKHGLSNDEFLRLLKPQ